MVWRYAVLTVAALVLALGLRRRRGPAARRSGRIEVGPLSEAWLAEQRAQHDDQP